MATFTGWIRHYYVTQEPIEGQEIAYRVDNTIDGYQPMTDFAPGESILSIDTEEEHTNWRMYFNEAVIVHRNGIRAILSSPAGVHFPVVVKFRFPCTNNMTEYEACIARLEAVLNMNVKDLEVYGDSILIISQFTG